MSNIKQIFLFLFISMMVVSCDMASGSGGGHLDADGFVLEVDGVEVYRQFLGEVTIDNLTLYEVDTIEVSVHFLDNDGNEIEHDDSEEVELSFNIVDTEIISIEDAEHDDDHHGSGFELIGISPGATTFTLSIMHDGHSDFTSLPINVTVIAVIN